jgi:hypothetical protein
LDNSEPESGGTKCQALVKTCFQETKRWCRIISKDFRRKLYRAPFVLEVIGVLAVIAYTYWTRQMLLDSTRPVIAIRSLEPEGCVCAEVRNLGRNTAIAQVHKGSGFSPTKLFSGPALVEYDRMIIPSGDIGNRIDFDKPGLAKRNTGYFYLSGRIDYGKGYYTRFCREYSITSSGHAEELCQDEKTNDNN